MPVTGWRIYSTQDHTTPVYSRNASCWAADVDLTPISPWNSDAGVQKAGTLISPRHVLFATHFLPSVLCDLRFVAADGTVVTRSLLALSPIITGVSPDLTVGLLDSDVPGTIGFAKVLPVSAGDKLPSLNVTHLPAAATDQDEKALVRNWTNFDAVQAPAAQCNFQQPFTGIGNDPLRDAYYENFVGGDSGSPLFVFINDEMILLTCDSIGGAGTGTSITGFITEINAAMTTLGGGYQLTEADLSGFPDL